MKHNKSFFKEKKGIKQSMRHEPEPFPRDIVNIKTDIQFSTILLTAFNENVEY